MVVYRFERLQNLTLMLYYSRGIFSRNIIWENEEHSLFIIISRIILV